MGINSYSFSIEMDSAGDVITDFDFPKIDKCNDEFICISYQKSKSIANNYNFSKNICPILQYNLTNNTLEWLFEENITKKGKSETIFRTMTISGYNEKEIKIYNDTFIMLN